MNDQDTIKQAYADALNTLYGALFDAFVAAPQNAQNQAKQRFSSGLALARKARDAALALL
jgi:hypothetical protein